MAEDPLNLDCFFPPKQEASELGMMGFDRATGRRNGGMTRYNRVHLMLGQPYYRFCDSMKFIGDWLKATTGPWWVEYETLREVGDYAARTRTVQDYAKQIGVAPISYAAKLHLAIPYEWGDCGWIVEARLVRRIDAYKGWGDIAFLSEDEARRDARDGGAKYIPLPKKEVYQLYIPEIWHHFDDAFVVVQKGPAKSFVI